MQTDNNARMTKTTTACGMSLRQPAMKWQDACPVGNGAIGAMLNGHVRNEQILINHERLWRRQAGKRNRNWPMSPTFAKSCVNCCTTVITTQPRTCCPKP